jgi:hypothetical protein
MGLIIELVWIQLSRENGVVTKANPSWSRVDRCKCCIHLRSLNVRHFGAVEAMGMKSMKSTSSSVA